MVTPEDVNQAYKLFLGREPENLEVVAVYCQNMHSIEQLSRVFMTSPEFMRRLGDVVEKQAGANMHRHPYHFPRIPVETMVSLENLDQMFERIIKQWDYLGATEPYWGVITQTQNYLTEFAGNSQQFYLSGRSICDAFLATLRRCDIDVKNFNLCLEVGCGVGRVTSHLAKVFNKVIATDISKSYLDLARVRLNAENTQNVELHHWHDLELINQLPQLDAIFSVITLQHNPPPIMRWIISTLLERLRFDGVAFLQIPTYKKDYIFEAERYLASSPPDTFEMHYFPQPDLFRLIKESNCICLEIREDSSIAEYDQVLSNTILIQKKSNEA